MQGNIITRRDIRWLTYDIPRLALILTIVVFVPPYISHAAYGRNAGHNAKVRDVQLLLLARGYNPGPIDGKCREQTQSAIEKFKGTLANIPPGPSCSIQFLESIKAHLIAPPNTAKSAQPDISSQSVPEQRSIESLSAAVSKLKARTK
jgi:peptidoglycan hydrolase-like protein with peptidoglycan-binding domain